MPAGGRVHPVAEEGFGRAADAYERGRPGYPADAVALLLDELGAGPDSEVMDLAAGTGKLTRQLRPHVGKVVAVEPVAAMRDRLVAGLPDVQVLDGTAEELPVGDGTVDAVFVAQAFHWFDPAPALAEIARVLRPGGGLGMLWNERDESVPWVAELGEIIQRRRHAPYAFDVDWSQLVAGAGGFSPLQSRDLPHRQRLDADGLVDRMLSTSFVATLPDADRAGIARRVREVASRLPQPVVLPYICHAHWCRRA